MDRGLSAAAHRHRDRNRCTRKVADAQAIPKISAAAVHDVAHLDEVISSLVENVGQACIRLEAGGIVAVSSGQLLSGADIVKRQLRVKAAAQSAAKDLETDTLAGLHADLVVIAGLCIGFAHDYARTGDGLGSRFRAIAIDL